MALDPSNWKVHENLNILTLVAVMSLLPWLLWKRTRAPSPGLRGRGILSHFSTSNVIHWLLNWPLNSSSFILSIPSCHTEFHMYTDTPLNYQPGHSTTLSHITIRHPSPVLELQCGWGKHTYTDQHMCMYMRACMYAYETHTHTHTIPTNIF